MELRIWEKRICWDPWEKTHFKGWIGCSVSTMRSCRSGLVGQQRDPFCQQISPFCCELALVYVTLKCSRPTLRKGREKKKKGAWEKKKRAAIIIRLAAQGDVWIPLRVKLQEKAHERTFCPITPYVTPVTLPPNLPPESPPPVHIPISRCHTHLSRKGRRLTVFHAGLMSFHLLMPFPLISCREWLPRHVPKGSTSRESSWRSLSAGSRFTVKDQGWVACQRVGPWQSCAVRPLPAAALWTYSIGHPEGRRSHGSVHNGCQGGHLVSLAGTVDILVQLQYLHRRFSRLCWNEMSHVHHCICKNPNSSPNITAK